MKSKASSRKIAAIVLAGLGIAGLSAASAANLALGSSTLGAGTVDVAACQKASDGKIGVAFETALDGTEYLASAVTLSNISTTCNGLNYKIAVDGKEMTGTVDAASGASMTMNLPSRLTAAEVDNVSVVFYN